MPVWELNLGLIVTWIGTSVLDHSATTAGFNLKLDLTYFETITIFWFFVIFLLLFFQEHSNTPTQKFSTETYKTGLI